VSQEPRPLGIAIVGAGGAGADVARAIEHVPGLSAVAVHDHDLTLARNLAEPVGARVHESLAGLLDDPAVDAAYIALPHDLLVPVAREVLLAGRHVLVEKPMATTLADLDDLAATAARVGRTAGVFYQMRFTKAAIAARQVVRDGTIGEVVGVNVRTIIDKPVDYWRAGLTGRSASGWRAEKARAGGGVVLMNTSHQLDIVFMATGLAVTTVAGHTRGLTPGIEVEDLAVAVLRFSNGALGTLAAGAHVAGANDEETIEIIGTAGRLLLNPYTRQLSVTRTDGAAGGAVALSDAPDTSSPFVTALTAFAEAALTAAPAPVGAPDARNVLATILAIYESASHGGRLTAVAG